MCVCACVGGFATAPPIRHGPEGPSRIRFIYTYILYTSYIAAAVGYPIPNVPLCTPLSPLSQTPIPSLPPSDHQCRQSSTGSGSTTTGTGVVVVLLIPSTPHNQSQCRRCPLLRYIAVAVSVPPRLSLSSKFYFTLLCFEETLVVAAVVIESVLLSKLISDPLYLLSDHCHVGHSPIANMAILI